MVWCCSVRAILTCVPVTSGLAQHASSGALSEFQFENSKSAFNEDVALDRVFLLTYDTLLAEPQLCELENLKAIFGRLGAAQAGRPGSWRTSTTT
jgi:hypothetical protein